MFVYEEKILKEYKIRVFQIVGWEGVWGMILTTIFILIFFFIPGDDYGSLENPLQATLQIAHNYKLLIGMILSTLVIGPFNYYGTNLTKYASAMHRCLIDSSRMCIIWFIAICCFWEKFTIFQAIGYGSIVLGNLLYTEIISLDRLFFDDRTKNSNKFNLSIQSKYDDNMEDRLFKEINTKIEINEKQNNFEDMTLDENYKCNDYKNMTFNSNQNENINNYDSMIQKNKQDSYEDKALLTK